MIELDVDDSSGRGLPYARVREVVDLVLGSELGDGRSNSSVHVGVHFVDETRIKDLNRNFRSKDAPTDALSFPVDGAIEVSGPRELGDVLICPALCTSQVEGLVHGLLHLLGYDHEVDAGEMLDRQDQLLVQLGG